MYTLFDFFVVSRTWILGSKIPNTAIPVLQNPSGIETLVYTYVCMLNKQYYIPNIFILVANIFIIRESFETPFLKLQTKINNLCLEMCTNGLNMNGIMLI